MIRFAELISPGDCVVEVGAHIGFIGQYFCHLVGASGLVFAFEPGPNNLPYVRRNLKRFSSARLVECAVADVNDSVDFYVEALTGQNNSLSQYPGFYYNSAKAFIPARYEKCTVTCVTLDSYVREKAISPNFVKIDVEGAERRVLRGMAYILSQ